MKKYLSLFGTMFAVLAVLSFPIAAVSCSGGGGDNDITAAATPSITVQPADGNWDVSEDATFTLSVTASASDGGTLSYQWYKAADNSATDGTAVDSESPSLTLDADDYGTNGSYYFYVVVKNTNDNATVTKTATVTSTIATVTVSGGAPPPANAATPSITGQPTGRSWDTSANATFTLSVTASVSDGGTLSYQWYKAPGNSATGGTAVGSESTSSTLTLNADDFDTNGSYYFYVVVKNTNNNATVTKTATVTSNAATVTVSGNTSTFEPGLVVWDASAVDANNIYTLSDDTQVKVDIFEDDKIGISFTPDLDVSGYTHIKFEFNGNVFNFSSTHDGGYGVQGTDSEGEPGKIGGLWLWVPWVGEFDYKDYDCGENYVVYPLNDPDGEVTTVELKFFMFKNTDGVTLNGFLKPDKVKKVTLIE
jgi:hypothetical protein